jgi:hypothetical protein
MCQANSRPATPLSDPNRAVETGARSKTMEWYTRTPEPEIAETTASRRSEVIEFGKEDPDDDVLEFEICKGLTCILD